MKTNPLFLFFISINVLLFSCSNSENDIDTNNFKGLYKIQTISSSLPVDLNNDGLKSNNYLQEIKSDYLLFNGETVNYGYNNELPSNFAEARPTKNQTNNTKFLNINFPIQRIDSVFQGNNNYFTINMEYVKLKTGLIYKLLNNTIEIESDPFNNFNFYNISNFEIQRITKDDFKIEFDYSVYDFSDNNWIQTRLTTHYTRVLEE